MKKIISEIGAVEVSTIATVLIISAIVASVSVIATSKYYEGVNANNPVIATIKSNKTANQEPSNTKTINQEPGSLIEETADWKTYANSEYGFEVKYPESYSVLENVPKQGITPSSYTSALKNAKTETLNETTFIDSKKASSYDGARTENDEIVRVTVYNNGNNYTLEQWLAKYRENSPVGVGLSFGMTDDEQKEITVDSVEGLIGDLGCCMTYQHSVFLKNENKVYQIAGSILDFETRIYPNEEMFNQMISTFKFTENLALVNQAKVFFINTNAPTTDKSIGCGDEAIGIDRIFPPTTTPLKAALENLLATSQETLDNGMGLYNSLAKQNWKLENVSIVGQEAIIQFSGKYIGTGICEDPRIIAQIEQTALQFSTVKKVSIFVDGISLKELMSGRGE